MIFFFWKPGLKAGIGSKPASIYISDKEKKGGGERRRRIKINNKEWIWLIKNSGRSNFFSFLT
jgi:hypothetical protein